MSRHTTHVFFDHEFPNGATHCLQSECGFSLYRGVLVQWDEDHDTRVLSLLDQMSAADLDHLLIVQEHEGSVSFVWKSHVPDPYRADGLHGVTVEGDWWAISSSRVCVGGPR